MKTRITLTAAAIAVLTGCGGNNTNNAAATNIATNAATNAATNLNAGATMNAGTMNATGMNATDMNATTNSGMTDVNATGNATTNY